MTFCEMYEKKCAECPNRYVCKNSTVKPKTRTGKTYKGFSRAQLIDILAEYAVFTAKVNNSHGGAKKNTAKSDYVSLYQTYPLSSKKYPVFSLSVMYDKMNAEIEKAKEIASFSVAR